MRTVCAWMLAALLWGSHADIMPRAQAAAVQTAAGAIHGTLTTWTLARHTAYAITPLTKTTEPREWIWIMPAGNVFANYPPAADSDGARYLNRFLDADAVVAGFDLGNTAGSPASMTLFVQFYEDMMRRYTIFEGARLFVMSRGGLEGYGYAERHPLNVARIGGVYPAVDWTNWPLETGQGLPVSPPDIGFTPVDLSLIDALNPINHLQPMAHASIKLMTIHGDKDTTVDLARNTLAVQRKYQALGGSMIVRVIPGMGHDTVGYFADLADFLLGR